jgi:hypothetical protein
VRALPGLGDVEVETPSLEDVYIGYMRRRRAEGHPAPVAEPVA